MHDKDVRLVSAISCRRVVRCALTGVRRNTDGKARATNGPTGARSCQSGADRRLQTDGCKLGDSDQRPLTGHADRTPSRKRGPLNEITRAGGGRT